MLEQEIVAKYGLSNDDARAAAASAMRLLESYIGKAYGAVDDTNSDEYKQMVEQDNRHWDKTFKDFLNYAKKHPTHKPVYMDMFKFSDDLYNKFKDAVGDDLEEKADKERAEADIAKAVAEKEDAEADNAEAKAALASSTEAAEPKNAISNNVLGALKDRRM